MVIEVTPEDITQAGQKAVDNPITRALHRATHEQWVIFDGHTAYEITPPYYSVTLPKIVTQHWQTYRTSGIMQPFSFEINFLQRKTANSTPTDAASDVSIAARYDARRPTKTGASNELISGGQHRTSTSSTIQRASDERFNGNNRQREERRKGDRRQGDRRHGERASSERRWRDLGHPVNRRVRVSA